MKTLVKEKTIKERAQKPFGSDNSKEIKSDFPLSEKDEVKLAEEKMRRAAKKKHLL
jgi:hypothetical protein